MGRAVQLGGDHVQLHDDRERYQNWEYTLIVLEATVEEDE